MIAVVLQHYPRIILLSMLIALELGVLSAVLIKQPPLPRKLLLTQAIVVVGILTVATLFIDNIHL